MGSGCFMQSTVLTLLARPVGSPSLGLLTDDQDPCLLGSSTQPRPGFAGSKCPSTQHSPELYILPTVLLLDTWRCPSTREGRACWAGVSEQSCTTPQSSSIQFKDSQAPERDKPDEQGALNTAALYHSPAQSRTVQPGTAQLSLVQSIPLQLSPVQFDVVQSSSVLPKSTQPRTAQFIKSRPDQLSLGKLSTD